MLCHFLETLKDPVVDVTITTTSECECYHQHYPHWVPGARCWDLNMDGHITIFASHSQRGLGWFAGRGRDGPKPLPLEFCYSKPSPADTPASRDLPEKLSKSSLTVAMMCTEEVNASHALQDRHLVVASPYQSKCWLLTNLAISIKPTEQHAGWEAMSLKMPALEGWIPSSMVLQLLQLCHPNDAAMFAPAACAFVAG